MTKLESRKETLENHYQLCGKLGALTGSTKTGKKISVELMKLEKIAHDGATAHCNGDEAFLANGLEYLFRSSEHAWPMFCAMIENRLEGILGSTPKGFFVNGDARGYALKIDSDSKLPLDLHQDWGGYQILSPDLGI